MGKGLRITIRTSRRGARDPEPDVAAPTVADARDGGTADGDAPIDEMLDGRVDPAPPFLRPTPYAVSPLIIE